MGKHAITHTPRPWFYQPCGEGHRVLSGSNEEVAIVPFTSGSDEGTSEANARLIAAAPELLDVLKAAEHLLACGSFGWKFQERIEASIRAAIEKAEGK